MSVGIRVAGCVLGALAVLAGPAAAQVEVGDNLSMNLNGTIAGGYSGSYGNLMSSSHSLSGSGNATLSGSYYSPNFLAFNVSPFYGQSRANSNYQSVFDSSGVNAAASIFSGSHFPGSVSYAKSYNSEGSFGVPGVNNFTTQGNSDTFGISWAENLPNAPSVSANFQKGSTDYTVFGTDQRGNSAFDSVTLRSGYVIDNFNLGAFFQRGASHSVVPQVVTNQPQTEERVASNSDGYGFNMSHLLPFRGGFSTTFTHSGFSTGLVNNRYNGSIDSISSNAGIQPTDKLHLAAGASYSDSLTGQLYEQVLTTGGVAPTVGLNQGSHGLDLIGTVGYAVSKKLQAEGDVERREQRFLGTTFGADTFSGSMLYTSGLFGGNVNAAFSIRDNRIDNSGQNSVGFTTNLNYNRRINGWVFGGSFGYAQNVQTLLVTYTTSYYNYSGNVRRRFGRFSWSSSASGARTGLTAQPGTDNRSQSYSTGLGFDRFITLNGTYSKSTGNAIQTATGLTPNPVPSPFVVPGLLILYGGDSYSVGLGSSPLKRLTIAAAYAKSNSNTAVGAVGSSSSNKQLNTLFQYQVRKLYVTGGYSRLQQGFSASGTQPAVVSSFFIGLSRWFNFF